MANMISIEIECEILSLYKPGMGYGEVGRLLNVSATTVRNVVLRGCVRSQEDRNKINLGSRPEWQPTPERLAEIEERKRECREKHFAHKRSVNY